MATSKKKQKNRRVSPEKSGLTDNGAKSEKIAYDRLLPVLLVSLICLLAVVALANYEVLRDSSLTWSQQVLHLAGSSGQLLLLVVFYGLYLMRFERAVVHSWRRLVPHVIFALIPIIAAKVLDEFGDRTSGNAVYYTPIALTAMAFAIAHGSRTAAYLTVLLSVIVVAIVLGPEGRVRFDLMTMLLAGGIVGSLSTGRIRRSSRPLKVGFTVGVVQAALVVSTQVAGGAQLNPSVIFVAAMNGLLCGAVVLMLLSLGVIEYAFRVTTDLTLLELSDQNHKLLRRLALEAPGTYHHSQILGGLAEAAGSAIGINALLLRVGAYFHDVGKINKPEYFSENETGGASLHNRLSPAMSTLIISAHTKDGTEIAHDYGLPEPIIDLIQQHHGTTLIEYFYRKAVDEQGGKAGVKEEFFRHSGPKPRTKEAGVLMLADAVESASRALTDPTSSRIERQVHDIVSRKLMDGQMDECNLTFAEVHRAEESLVKSLTHIYHGRVKYPKPVEKKASKTPSPTSESYDPLPLG